MIPQIMLFVKRKLANMLQYKINQTLKKQMVEGKKISHRFTLKERIQAISKAQKSPITLSPENIKI